MGDVIGWKTAEEIMKILAKESALVSGMSIEEAAAAYGYTLTKSGMYVKTVTDVGVAAGEAATASEAIAGAAATGGATTTAANLTLYTTAEGATAVGGIGSIALPVAACCLAAAGGYKLGNVIGDYIDEKYPNFFTGMFESVSEFLTGDEKSLAFVFDEKGEAFMPEASVEKIQRYLEQSLAETKPDSVISNNSQIYFINAYIGMKYNTNVTKGFKPSCQKIVSLTNTSPVYCYCYTESEGNNAGLNTVFLSKEPFTLVYTTYRYIDGVLQDYGSNTHDVTYKDIYNNKGCYSLLQSAGRLADAVDFPDFNNVPLTVISDGYDMQAAIYEILYGNIQSNSNVPSGLQKGDKPDKGKIEVPSKYPSWYPIPLPATNPYQLPSEFPDPNSDPDPNRVTPYLPQPQPYPEKVPLPAPSPSPNPNPIIVPVPNYIPVPLPTPSPDADPSAEPVPNPNPAPKPTPTPKPHDTGKTPAPILPVVPPISSEADGLLHVYNPTSAQINEFGRWLWTTFSGDLIDTIAKLFNNPMDAVIGLHELYCTPSTGSTTTIKAGFLDSGVTSRLVDSRYTEINCGAITVPEYWGNYLDYSPYTKVYCYLPFIGIVELNTDDIVGHGVQITYKIDSYNGSCVAMITTAKKQDEESVVYQFSGNCSVEVPITSGMKSALQSALIGAATCAVGAGAVGIAGSALATAAVAGGMKRGLNSKNTVAHSGTFGSSYGAMGIKKPYIIVKRPVQKVVHGYNKNYGYPAHSMVTIGNCSGYLRCRDFEVVSSTATEEEKKRIEVLLKEGVYV